MLKDFIKLEQGEYLIQNGSNSSVGLAVIQLAKALGYRTINLVRERADAEATQALKNGLTELGADHVVTHAEAHHKSFKSWVISELTGGKGVRLALNCVSGPDAIPMTGVMADSGHFVTYGSLSRKPLTFPNGWFIFRDGHASGFNLNRWREQHTQEERDVMFEELGDFIRKKQLRAPAHRIVDLTNLKGEDLLQKVQMAISAHSAGTSNQKTLFQFF